MVRFYVYTCNYYNLDSIFYSHASEVLWWISTIFSILLLEIRALMGTSRGHFLYSLSPGKDASNNSSQKFPSLLLRMTTYTALLYLLSSNFHVNIGHFGNSGFFLKYGKFCHHQKCKRWCRLVPPFQAYAQPKYILKRSGIM